ncbi:4-amino-4-deoxy-L-arabinose transferase-like glycosyltransferase [Streptomyces umbrinus]|uniref:4-amino-4-deoxy-L-arabinose transferase-like glycosyltransferase n=1 Tax=Streptomyces umbrinus TaxID=67370 RepID=A0ABU0T1M8_9ACTN|nr:hypothetical protein [Streptomyces umbrinus]MDQ1029717.1 4-amino-4-deoxy-L-arabinose transferase-like glycosyltransferase [Streptomyces umbrinus]
MSDEVTRIDNPNSSEYVSQLLGLTIQNLAGTGVVTEVTDAPAPGRKSSLIVDITIGLGVAAAWDMLKFSASALRPSRRPSTGDEIILNGKRYSISEIDEEGSDAPVDDE